MSATLTLNGRRVSVDIERELREYDWTRAIWQADKLLAVSPFRYDKTPSFYVYLEDTLTAKAGYWQDSGSGERGGFVKLLAFLRGEDEYSTAEYLLAEYASELADPYAEDYELEVPNLTIAERRRPLDKRILDAYQFRHPYLESRMIPDEIQVLYGVGYDRKRHAVTMPWYNPDGTLANVKYRRVDSKVFWYEKGARPIRECVYGIHIAYERRIKRAALVEAEVDAQTLAAAGIFGVATGGSAFNETKRDIILRSPIEELVIMADHDAAGQKLKRQIIEAFRGKLTVKVAGYPKRWKDPNELAANSGLTAVREYVEGAREVRSKIPKLL
ncbi:toprim domain-containing protein [Paenibacillus sp. HWE-109]|uniref:toprim domain-containing protein n=1 Tax=Paenibacillus sp. HWE-109 TaxID=1306526 RepID=UPI001EDFBAF2|nr:toprim domain-containing protein [Paenibacillus sp. HWE-109]UKS30212.1 toprim domain-containing protein [Paenibacillus sp. HWE-109]